jgi:hypothetical protein
VIQAALEARLCTKIAFFYRRNFLTDIAPHVANSLIFHGRRCAFATGSLLEPALGGGSGLSRGRFSTKLFTNFVDIWKIPLNTAT